MIYGPADKVTYKCKACKKWEKTIPAAWADQKPRFCMNQKCELSVKKGKGRKSFRRSPEMLEIILPKKSIAPAASKSEKTRRRRKVSKTQESSNGPKDSGQSSDKETSS